MERVDKKKKDKIMDMIEKAGSEEYETEWDDRGRIGKQKKKSEIKKGKKAKASGSQFELKVRKDLESKGRVVDKWTNNVEFGKDKNGKDVLETGKIISAKKHWKFNPYRKIMMPSAQGTGFPDFISIKKVSEGLYSVIGVEVKMNGILSKIEKEKCRWYLDNGIFSAIWIAKKGEKRGQIEYVDFEEKWGKKYNKT